jgi:flagellar protein FliS
MMTGTKYGAAAYAQVGVQTGVAAATPHRLIEMLFDGALVAIRQARDAMGVRDFAGKGAAVSRAIDIIENGLRASLDRAAGGELASQLDNLYNYMTARLLDASVHNRIEPLDEVARLLGEIRGAWASIGDSAAAAQTTTKESRK